jgi:uncharacterized protein (TIGR02646 family)
VLFQRQEKPPAKKKYQHYKPELRRDFQYRCAYCLIHEAHYGGLRNYHVDHFRPKGKKKFKHLALVYTNLYYACGLCNTFKGRHWPTVKEEQAGYGYVDPCQEDPYEDHIKVDEKDGSARTLTRAGAYMVAHLRLDREQLKKHRRRLNEAKQNFQQAHDALDTAGLPAERAAEIQKVIEEIEREYLNPSPPYEVEDLEA